MRAAETARTVIGIVGNVISFFLFLSPAPTFYSIWRKGSVEQFSPVPYLCALINCMAWVLYGLPIIRPNNVLVATINGVGLGIELIYVLLFLIYSDKKKRIQVFLVLVVELIFISLLIVLLLTLVPKQSTRSAISGTVAIVFNIMMYASPLSVMKLVITTKSVEYMPFFLSLASFANGVAWTTYALVDPKEVDAFVAGPNGVGALLGLVQLILYGMYYKSTQRQIAERRPKAEVGLAEL